MTPHRNGSTAARVAVLGWGEAGSDIGSGLLSAGCDIRAYDPNVKIPEAAGPRSSEADAVRDATIVLSVNSAHDAANAFDNAVAALPPGAIWVDLNAAAPSLKASLAAKSPSHNVVDVAIMAPVPGKGLRVPMVASGTSASEFAAVLNSFGGNVTVLDGPAGAASSRKLLRSVFYKGLAAAVVEALAGARAAGCEDWLRKNISSELAGFDATTIDRLVDGTHQHARRRSDEMDAAAQQLRDLGVEARIADATHQLLISLVNKSATASS